MNDDQHFYPCDSIDLDELADHDLRDRGMFGVDPIPRSPRSALQQWLSHPSAQALHTEESTAVAATMPDPELDQLRTRLAQIKARAELLRDPGWLDELTPAEQDADRQAATQIRTMRREQTLAAAMADGKLSARARRVDNRLARIELADRLWGRRALARRNRLLNPASRLAGLHRAHVASSAALIGVAIAGISWTSAGVHDAIVGPDGSPLAYVVEPIFSIPLLVIMAISAHATQWNQTFPPAAHRNRVYALEGFLLASTIALNTVSVLPGAGTWHNTATLLAHLIPPMLIVVAVVLQPLIAGFLADILMTTATADAAGNTPPRLTSETDLTLRLLARVTAAIARGELTDWATTGLPSISAIQRYLRCEKRRAQLVWDALRLLDHNRRTSGTSRDISSVTTHAASNTDQDRSAP
jgi:hypothetical protein